MPRNWLSSLLIGIDRAWARCGDRFPLGPESLKEGARPVPRARPLGIFLADLFFISTARVRSCRPSLLYLAIMAIPLFWAGGELSRRKVSMYPDNHLWLSLNMALNGVFCRAPTSLSEEHDIARYVFDHPRLVRVPLRDVVAQAAGSVDEYCGTVTRPHVNNENSLMLQMRLWLLLDRGLSLHSLGVLLQATRLAALLVFCYALLESGLSLCFCGVALAGGLGILRNLDHEYYSMYPFLFVLLLLSIGLYMLGLRHSVQRSLSTSTFLALVMGWLAAYGVNMRTSHFPVYMAIFVVYVWAAHRSEAVLGQARRRGWRIRWLATATGGFALGYGLFAYSFIRPLQVPPERRWQQNYPYHVIAHPLVLSLALPENALSLR